MAKNFTLLILVALIVLPTVSALTITDTTFFASETNSTIFVDSIVLDQVIVTNQTIEFFGLVSSGSNFTNTNATFNASASFFDLGLNLTIRNVNTSIDLFTSSLSVQNFNVTFTSGQVITITGALLSSPQDIACSTMIDQFSSYPILIGLIGLLILFAFLIIALSASSGTGVSEKAIVTSFIGFIFIAVLVVVAIFLISNLCSFI